MTVTDDQRAALESTRGLTRVRRGYTLDSVRWDTPPTPTVTLGTATLVGGGSGTATVSRTANTASNTATFNGHASVYGKGYEMYGGPDKGGWTEFVDAGAGKKTLSENPDVAFLVNHEGLTLARTKAKTMTLAEDNIGLKVNATLDTRVSIVNDIRILMDAGNLDEMSFAFRVTRQKWLTADGEEVPWWDLAGIERHITEYNINKGDVSIVNYGANPFTDANLRSITEVLREFTADAHRFDEPDLRSALAFIEGLLPKPDDTIDPEVLATAMEAQRRAWLAAHDALRV